MTKHEKIANIIAFLTILFGEDHACFEAILKLNPNYVIEKFERYIASNRAQYEWGMHPTLRRNIFHRYVDKWHLELTDDEYLRRNEVREVL